MDRLLQDLQLSSALILPLVDGLAVFTLLLLIYRLLRRSGALRPLALPYIIGALALSAAVGLAAAFNRLGRPMGDTLHDILLAAIVCSWGFVGLGLIEDLLVGRW